MSRQIQRNEEPAAEKNPTTSAAVAAVAEETGSTYLRKCAELLAREESGASVFKEGPRDTAYYGWDGTYVVLNLRAIAAASSATFCFVD